MIIEKVLDESFDKAIRELILELLQMNRTILLGDEELNSSDANITIPYKPIKNGDDNPGFVKAEYEFSRLTMGPGSLVSSCNKFLVFIGMLINNGYKGGKTIFKPKIMEKMLTRYV